MRVAVIGAGIVGVSVAYRLCEGGARVWLIDRGNPGDGTTAASFAWVNANRKTPRDYFELNHASMQEHLRLREELPGGAPWLHGDGNLEWAGAEGLEELEHRVERLRSWGYATGWLEASDVNESLEPDVTFPERDTPVAFFPDEAWVDAPRLAKDFGKFARRNGAEARFGVAASSIETSGGSISAVGLADGGNVPVDAVVNAAGPEAGRVAALIGRELPLSPSRGLLVRLSINGTPLHRVLHSPGVNIRPDGPSLIVLHHGSVDALLAGNADVETLASELLDRARAVVPALVSARIVDTRIGVRPIPVDGLPSVGAVAGIPGYYEAATHSGVTLGPLIGRLLAQEILTGEIDPLLAPFRPERSGSWSNVRK